MPTQEERVAALEQQFSAFQKDNAAKIHEVQENTTILLGVIREQGRDIRAIFGHLEIVDHRLDRIENRLDQMENRLDRMENRLDRMENRLVRLETKSDEHTALLIQILERLSG
jgi:chromosome segregation ATPase